MSSLALFAALTVVQQKAEVKLRNVWFCPFIEVTSNSPLDQTPNGTYDIRDAFGGTYGTVRGEGGHVVFEDDNGGPGQPDFIEWNTKEAAQIERLIFCWQDDSPGNNWRNLARFTLMGRRSNSGEWTTLWQENTPMSVGRFTMEKKVLFSEPFQYFRAEIYRSGGTNGTAVAPRICAIEAYGKFVPQN